MQTSERRRHDRRPAVRALFALLILGFVVQLAVVKIWREPYPGVFQPGFGGVHQKGVTVIQEPTVTTSYRDGSELVLGHDEVMAQSEALKAAIFRSAFGSDSPRRTHPETIAWLERRLSDLGGGRQPERAVIDWREVTYDLKDERPPRSTSTDRTVISFGDRRG